MQDYNLAQKALEHIPKHDKYRLIRQPRNEFIDGFLGGFYTEDDYNNSLNFTNFKFAYAQDCVMEWEANPAMWGVKGDKIEIIEDIKTIQKVRVKDSLNSKRYIRISNPAFSTDGRYSIIFIERFSNMNLTNPIGIVLIFIKVGDEWLYFTEFTAYMS